MIGDDHALTLGYVARHVPPASRIGIDVAVLDIAQDFLLAHRWLSPREDWDDEQIGLLTHPPPSLSELEARLHRLYAWLRDLTEKEGRLASADARDRSEVIRAVRDLEHSALTDTQLWSDARRPTYGCRSPGTGSLTAMDRETLDLVAEVPVANHAVVCNRYTPHWDT